MALIKLQFQPGINKEITTLGGKGGWFACNNVRFRSGVAEKIGGWTADNGVTNSALKPTTGSYWGVAKSLFSWASIVGYNLMGIGTNVKYYIQNGDGGYFYDVTPVMTTTAAGAITFAATTGSKVLTVTSSTAIELTSGTFVTFSGATGLGGNITSTILNAEFQITKVLSTTVFQIAASVAANSSDTGSGGTATVGAFQYNAGPTQYSVGVGWGAGGWGGITPGFPSGGWGQSTGGYQLRLWSQSNYGENLVMNPRGGPLFYWVTSSTPSSFYRAQQVSSTNTNTFSGDSGNQYYWFADGAIFTASITAGQMTVTAMTTGYINIGATITGTGIGSGVTITGFVSGSQGYEGVYTTSDSGLTISSTTVTSTISACPTVANFVLVSDQSRFVIAFGTDNTGDTVQDPMLVSWSDQENILTWNPTATNQAGNYRLSQGSQIITAVQSRQEILVFTDTAIYSMQYLGPPYVWGFQIMGSNISIMSPNAAVIANNTLFWMGVDKFYMYNGTVQTLPSTLRKYVFENINTSQSYQVFAGVNEGFSEVWWYYCSSSSNTIDSYVIYNYVDNTWVYGSMARTAWTYSPLRGYPVATGYASPALSSGNLIYHELGVDDGTTTPASPINAYIQSSDFDIGDGDRYGFAWRMIPDVSFDGSNVDDPQMYMTLLPRQNPGAAYTVNVTPPVVSSTQDYSNTPFYGTQQFTTQINIRVRGRQIAAVFGSNTLGTQWQVGVPRMDVRPDGRRA